MKTVDPVLEQLKSGVRRFRAEVFPARAEAFREAATSPQRPHTLFITCSDSRLDPMEITGAGMGEIFVTRNIGNMVPPDVGMQDGISAVIEYAVSALRVRHIVICGHSDCGAMKALLAPATIEPMPAVTNWLKNAEAAVSMARTAAEDDRSDAPSLRILTEQNVRLQLEHLVTHPCVAEGMARGEVSISGWVYEIGSGEVSIISGSDQEFAPVKQGSTDAQKT